DSAAFFLSTRRDFPRRSSRESRPGRPSRALTIPEANIRQRDAPPDAFRLWASAWRCGAGALPLGFDPEVEGRKMFESLQERLGSILNGLTGRGALSEADV